MAVNFYNDINCNVIPLRCQDSILEQYVFVCLSGGRYVYKCMFNTAILRQHSNVIECIYICMYVCMHACMLAGIHEHVCMYKIFATHEPLQSH